MKELNEHLAIQTYIAGDDASVADIVSLVVIYTDFGKLSHQLKYYDYCFLSRWFDTIQYLIKSNGVLEIIPIKKEAPKEKKEEQKK